MKSLFSLALILLLALVACGPENTPPEVMQQFETLKQSLDEQKVGESIKQLERFAEAYRKYSVSRIAQEEVRSLKERVDGRFIQARNLARDGDMDTAELMLNDLANNLPETKDGKLAKEYLDVDFPMFKVNRLIASREVDQAKEILLQLQKKELTGLQARQVEMLLDSVSNMQLALGQAQRAGCLSAGRNLQILLMQMMAEDGRAPDSLDLRNLESARTTQRNILTRHLSAIEGYQSSDAGFELVAVCKGGPLKIKVTQEMVEVFE